MPKAIAVQTGDGFFLVEVDRRVDPPPGYQLPPPADEDEDEDEGEHPPGTESVSNTKRIERQFPEVEALIVACCKGLHGAITKIPRPEKFAVEFGIKFGGEAGVPVVSKVSGECSFKVTIEWKTSPPPPPLMTPPPPMTPPTR